MVAEGAWRLTDERGGTVIRARAGEAWTIHRDGRRLRATRTDGTATPWTTTALRQVVDAACGERQGRGQALSRRAHVRRHRQRHPRRQHAATRGLPARSRAARDRRPRRQRARRRGGTGRRGALVHRPSSRDRARRYGSQSALRFCRIGERPGYAGREPSCHSPTRRSPRPRAACCSTRAGWSRRRSTRPAAARRHPPRRFGGRTASRTSSASATGSPGATALLLRHRAALRLVAHPLRHGTGRCGASLHRHLRDGREERARQRPRHQRRLAHGERAGRDALGAHHERHIPAARQRRALGVAVAEWRVAEQPLFFRLRRRRRGGAHRAPRHPRQRLWPRRRDVPVGRDRPRARGAGMPAPSSARMYPGTTLGPIPAGLLTP